MTSIGYDALDYDQPALQQVMRAHYDKIIDFITQPAFEALMLEMSTLQPAERPRFVAEVLIDPEVLKRRGVTVPDGILVQRSAFGDQRPTLFAVKHFLPKAYANVWENVNITFDNAYVDAAVSRDRDTCWRAPLSPQQQAEVIAAA